MTRREYSPHIKTLLHFDFPYYAEVNDGLKDEINWGTWERKGAAKLAGSKIPADIILSGSPKFGYRCLYTASSADYITGRGKSLSLPSFETSFWVRAGGSAAGNVMQLLSGSDVIFTLRINTALTFTATCPAIGLNAESSGKVSLGAWTHIRLRIDSSAKTYTFLINDVPSGTQEGLTGSLPVFNTINLGGFNGQIDEFMVRDNFTSGVPSIPEQAVCSLQDFGGWGNSRHGNVTFTASAVMNTTGQISSKTNATTYKLTSVSAGKFGTFAAGDEIMILDRGNGQFCFRTVTSYKSSVLTFNSAPDFDPEISSLIVQVPNFSALTVNPGIVVKPGKGGICAFRVKGSCTINGQIITSGTGTRRTDYLQIDHGKLADRFLFGEGGGIFITCGGTFTAPSTARLGAEWSGAGEGGIPVSESAGTGGGAGYGGGGGSRSKGLGGHGGVGGGGGGGDVYTAGDAGQTNTTGGYGHSQTDKIYSGGTQGKDPGATPAKNSTNQETGGGGAGGSGGDVSSSPKGGTSGACLILICNILRVDSAAISTGGGGGKISSSSGSGGGGTGFCYIACEEVG